MARPYRIQGEGLLYHITSRGDDRKKIFISDHDYNKFLEYLKLAQDKYKFYLYAYCLMDNHYHLLLETTQPNLSKIMQYINTAYTIYYNKKRNKCGHLFQGRYKSILVEGDVYFMQLTRYIHLNPVKAKMVLTANEYRWSSYNLYIKNQSSDIVDIERVKQLLDIDIKKYSVFVNSKQDKQFDLKNYIYAGFLLGGKEFIKEQLDEINLLTVEKDFAHKKKICSMNYERIVKETASYYRIDPDVLLKSANKPLQAKKIAVHLLKQYSGLTNKDIGTMFGISYSAVSKIDSTIKLSLLKNKQVAKDVKKIISHFKV